MTEHPALTSAILSRVKQFHELAYVAGAHHEKMDGSGYPGKLRRRDLPIEARILAVADIFGALIEDRPYRRGFDPEGALAILANDMPGKLDVDCFLALASVAPTLPVVRCQPESVFEPASRVETPVVFEPVHG
jgi:HD-GYP domain-containing protein (c-di-GMP phosphodiesterase class II)